jgi:hypothetical protein
MTRRIIQAETITGTMVFLFDDSAVLMLVPLGEGKSFFMNTTTIAQHHTSVLTIISGSHR